jgi:hypothetical protein
MGGGFPACRAFGAAGVYYVQLIKPAEKIVGQEADASVNAARLPALHNAGWLSSEVETAFVFGLSRFRGPHRSVMEMTPETCPRSCTPASGRRFQGRGIGDRLLARLLATAEPGQPIPASTGASTGASADRAG